MAAACLLLCYRGLLLTYAPLSKQTSPVTISPCTHNIPCRSSCIIVSCLLVAAGASQWPRYNETLWLCCLLRQPAAFQLHQQQQIFPLFPSFSLSAITAWPTSPWLPVQNGCEEEAERWLTRCFSDCDLWLRRSGRESEVETAQQTHTADRGLRVTSFTPTSLLPLTRPRSLLPYSDDMQSCNYDKEQQRICKPRDKGSGGTDCFQTTKRLKI